MLCEKQDLDEKSHREPTDKGEARQNPPHLHFSRYQKPIQVHRPAILGQTVLVSKTLRILATDRAVVASTNELTSDREAEAWNRVS